MKISGFVFWLMAAVALLCAGWAVLSTRALRSQMDLIRIERDLAKVSERLMRTEMNERTLLAERIINELAADARAGDLAQVNFAVLAPTLDNVRDARGLLLWTSTPQRAVLRIAGLPVVATEMEYRLWQRDVADAAPVGLATFRPDARGMGAGKIERGVSIAPTTEFWVSLEEVGSSRPNGPIVLRGPL